MASIHAVKLGLALEAYGIQLRLWKEAGERQWGASLRDDGGQTHLEFEEDSLAMAKLHLVAEARRRASLRSNVGDLPGCDEFSNSWKPVNIGKEQEPST